MTGAIGDSRIPIRSALLEPERRVDGEVKVTGAALYAGDMVRPGMLWAAFRRSDIPHAQLRAIDVSAARDVPGVYAVITGADIGDVRFGRRLFDQPVLAVDRVRFIGERIAAVAAETRDAAEEAAHAISVEYDELPAVLSSEEALRPDAAVLHPNPEVYRYLGSARPLGPHPNVQGRQVVAKAESELEAAFGASARVFEHRFTLPRQHHGYIEPHATLVWIDAEGVIHVVSTNKAPFQLRNQMALALDLPVERIDVDSGFIGGDFGGKGYSPDEYACYFLARASGRPVKFTTSYAEELAAMNPRHAAVVELRTGVDGDGRFLAHRARLVFDGGAYASAKPLPHLGLPGWTQVMTPYRIPHVLIEAMTVYTNTAPGGHMRSPGEVQAVFAGESHVDAIARALGQDPLGFRILNAIRPGDTGPGGEQFREPRSIDVLERLRSDAGWDEPLPPGHGRGAAVFVGHVGAGKAALRLTLESDGVVTIRTGLPDQGGGSHTMLQRVVAATLSMPASRIRVLRATTGSAIEDAGVGASRVTHLGSRAAVIASEALRSRIEAVATETLGEAEERVQLDGEWLVGAGGRNRVRLADASPTLLAQGPIEAEGTYEVVPLQHDRPIDANFGAYAAEVEVDVETGAIKVAKVTLVVDVGTIVNPVAHQGQLEGGFVFGLGAALMEELVVEDGRVATLSLGDYKLPTAMDVPPLRTVLLPTDQGPGAFGAKMVGELTNAGVAPAIANAVADATGVRLVSLPLTAEKTLAAIDGRDRDASPGPRRPES
jgi:carbon-monoxide dehydrogenase large subunit